MIALARWLPLAWVALRGVGGRLGGWLGRVRLGPSFGAGAVGGALTWRELARRPGTVLVVAFVVVAWVLSRGRGRA